MASREDLLRASQCAAEVYQSSGAADRILHGGYTRVDPFIVAASAELTLMLQPMEALLGAFIRNEQSGILVNADRPPGLIHMTCAHELGHYFLGHTSTADQILDYGSGAPAIEQQADWFAYQLMMPRTLIARTMRRKGWNTGSLRDPRIVYQLSLRLGASYQAMVWSLYRHNLLLLSRREVEDLSRTPPQRIKRQLAGTEAVTGVADVWQLDKADHDVVIEPRPNDVFVLDLPTHAPAGYLWTVTEATEAGFRLVPESVSSDLARVPRLQEPTIGSQGFQRYVLKRDGRNSPAVPNSRHEFNFAEVRPWLGVTSQNDEFRTSAEFESIGYGLSRWSRERLVDEIAQT